MIALTTATPAVCAACLASLVEVVEAFTIVPAAGMLRGWAGLAVLVLTVVTLGPLLDWVLTGTKAPTTCRPCAGPLDTSRSGRIA